jgi:ornithine cyclodeaminase
MLLRILSENDVRSVLTLPEAIDLQSEAFTALAEGRSIEGLRSFAQSTAPPGISIFNPSFLKDGEGFGVKVVSDFYENADRDVPRMTALVTLFDGMTGQPRTVMEGGYLTDVRTGAGTALAARYLARKDSRCIVVVGVGRLARNQLEALCVEHEIERVLVVTRSPEKAEAFIGRMQALGDGIPADMRLVDDRDKAIADADIVACATTSHDPVFSGTALRPGTFVAAAGAYAPTMREVDNETIQRANRHVIDSPRDCLANAGDFQIPADEGNFNLERVVGIADLIAGRTAGRESDDEITFYKSMGVPIQDLITAQFVEKQAIDQDLGTVIDIGGDHD